MMRIVACHYESSPPSVNAMSYNKEIQIEKDMKMNGKRKRRRL
jgi:hypothetical protein